MGRSEQIIAYLIRRSANPALAGTASAGIAPAAVPAPDGAHAEKLRVTESLSFLLTFYRLFARWHVTKVYDLR